MPHIPGTRDRRTAGAGCLLWAIPDVVSIPGIHPEIKRVERLNVPEAMAQAVRDSEKFNDGMPVLFHRRNRQGWLCTMRLEDWMKIYKPQGCRCGRHCSTAETGEK